MLSHKGCSYELGHLKKHSDSVRWYVDKVTITMPEVDPWNGVHVEHPCMSATLSETAHEAAKRAEEQGIVTIEAMLEAAEPRQEAAAAAG